MVRICWPCTCVCVFSAVSSLKPNYLRTLAFESQQHTMSDCNAFSLPSTNSNSRPHSRSIGSSPSLVKDEAKETKQQSAVNVSDAVTALQKMLL